MTLASPDYIYIYTYIYDCFEWQCETDSFSFFEQAFLAIFLALWAKRDSRLMLMCICIESALLQGAS